MNPPVAERSPRTAGGRGLVEGAVGAVEGGEEEVGSGGVGSVVEGSSLGISASVVSGSVAAVSGLGANFESASPFACRGAPRVGPPRPRPLPRCEGICCVIGKDIGSEGGLKEVCSSFCVTSSTGALEEGWKGTISSSKRSSSPRDCEKSSMTQGWFGCRICI